MSVREVDGDPVAHRGRGGQDDAAPLDLQVDPVLPVPDDDGALRVHDLDDLGVELHTVAQGRGDALRQRGRAAHDAPVQSLADVPHEAEVADPGTGRDLVRVRGGAGDRRVEQRSRVLGQVAHEVAEAAAVLEVVDPLLADGRVLAGALAHDARVPQDLPAHLDAGLDERDARRQRHGDAERVGLDRPLDQELAVHRHARQRAGHLRRGDARLGQEGVGGRSRAGEHVPAPVQPVPAAPLRSDAAADPAAGLQEHRVPVPQSPSGCQAGEAASDDDDVLHAEGPFSGITTRSERRGR